MSRSQSVRNGREKVGDLHYSWWLYDRPTTVPTLTHCKNKLTVPSFHYPRLLPPPRLLPLPTHVINARSLPQCPFPHFEAIGRPRMALRDVLDPCIHTSFQTTLSVVGFAAGFLTRQSSFVDSESRSTRYYSWILFPSGLGGARVLGFKLLRLGLMWSTSGRVDSRVHIIVWSWGVHGQHGESRLFGNLWLTQHGYASNSRLHASITGPSVSDCHLSCL